MIFKVWSDEMVVFTRMENNNIMVVLASPWVAVCLVTLLVNQYMVLLGTSEMFEPTLDQQLRRIRSFQKYSKIILQGHALLLLLLLFLEGHSKTLEGNRIPRFVSETKTSNFRIVA